MPAEVQNVLYAAAKGIATSARLGCRKPSPSRLSPCTSSVASVASESASCATRRSVPLRLSRRPPISRPMQTERLESTSAALPEARLSSQKTCGAVDVATTVDRLALIDRSNRGRLRGSWGRAGRLLGRQAHGELGPAPWGVLGADLSVVRAHQA